MGKNKKADKTAKKVTKKVEVPIAEEKKETPVEVKVEETPTPDPVPAVEEKKEETPTKTEATEAPKAKKEKEEGKKQPAKSAQSKKQEEILIPEVVNKEEKKEKEEDPVPSISQGIIKIADGERIDANHAIDLMKMVHTEYVSNNDAPQNLRIAMKGQFDAMAMIALMQYNAQVENDFKTLGVKVTNTMAVQMEKVAREMFGITLKGLPAPNDPNQTVINFGESDIPEEVKKEAKKDAAAAEIPVPEPDPKMPDKEKLAALRTIFSQRKGIGNNIMNGIEWARAAFSFSKEEKKSVIFANIVDKGTDAMLLSGLRNMVTGKVRAEHSSLGAHAILKSWCPKLSDREIAELIQVALAYNEEKKTADWNRNAGDDKQTTVEKELKFVNANILAGASEKVIDAILNKKPEVVVSKDSLGEDVRVDTASIRKSLITAYGDSDELLKDKVHELAKYYLKPILRLSNYVDKSAYAEAKPKAKK